MMRRWFYGMWVLIVFLAIVWTRGEAEAATCDTTLSEVQTLITQAKTALDNGDTVTASALLSGAQAILNTAVQAGAEVVPAATVEEVPAATAEVVAPGAEVPAATAEAAAAVEPTVLPEPTAVAMVEASPALLVVNAPAIPDGMGTLFLHFVNTSIDAGPIDIYSKDTGDVPIVQNLAYGQYTGAARFRAGQQVFIARPAGSGAGGEELYRMKWDFNANSTWMVIAAGVRSTYSFIVEPVTILRSNLNNGKARVRIVNWVSGGERLSMFTDTGAQLANGLGWVGVSDKEIDPGTYALTVTGATSGAALSDPTPPMTFEANTVYVLLILGGKDGNPRASIVPIVSQRDTTRVRFINNRAETVDVHSRPTNERVLADFAPGASTDFIPLHSGAITFLAYLPGTGPTGQQKGGVSLQMRPGTDVTISLTANGSMEVIETVFTP